MQRFAAFTVMLATALVTGCSRDATAPVPSTPVSASVAVSPAPGATAVSLSAPVTVTFNYPMDSASCAARFAVMRGDSTGALVGGRMTWDSAYKHMSYAPDSMMAPGTTYFVTLRDSMMTQGFMMSDSAMGMGGGGGMMGGGQHWMSSAPMMFNQPPLGATRTATGMRWSFTTGS